MRTTKYTEWGCPRGTHQARIASARLINKTNGNNDNEMLDIIFELPELTSPIRVYQARVKYWHGSLHRFIRDFSAILGEDAIGKMFTSESELIPDTLTSMVGKRLDIEIAHQYTDGYDEPLCKVIKLKPSGALVKDLVEAA